MAEILTESFCERCGTRYTFQTAAPRGRRFARLRVASKGLRNYVLEDGSSLEDAFGEARSEEERAISGQQLEAFHKTFNFCLSCRQYTCGNCWNTAENRCLSCAPDLSREVMPAPFPDLVALGSDSAISPERAALADMAWPEADLARSGADAEGPEPVVAGLAALPMLSAEGVATEPDAVPSEQPQIGATAFALAGALAAGPEADAGAVAEPVASVAEPETAALEPEPEPIAAIAAEPVAEPEAVEEALEAAAEPEAVEPEAVAEVVEAEAEPEAVEAEAEPEAVEAAAEPEAVGEEAPDAVAAAALAGAAAATALEPEPSPEGPAPPKTADRAAKAAAATALLFGRFRPGQNLDAALDAYERGETIPAPEATETELAPSIAEGERTTRAPELEIAAAAAVAAVAAADAAAAPEPEPVRASGAAREPEAEAAVVPEPEPEPAAAATEPEPVAPAEPEPPVAPSTPRPSRDDRVELPVWTIVAPDNQAPTPAATPAWPPVVPPPASGSPAWPAAAWAVPDQPIAAVRAREAMWAESSRDVIDRTPTGVQSCVSCGLPLSATARFCRRCGSRQG